MKIISSFAIEKQAFIYSRLDINWYQPKKLRKYTVKLFIVVFLFLYLFKPFVVNETELKYPFLFICFLHALSPAIINFIFFSFIVSFNKTKTNQVQYTVAQSIGSFLIIFFLFGTASFLMRDIIYTNANNWSLRYYYEELRNAYLGGGLIVSYFIFAGFYFRGTEKQLHINAQNIATAALAPVKSSVIFIQALVKVDDFKFDPVHFLFAKAEGNYIELAIKTPEGIKRELKRISLKQFELQLVNFPYLFRCHRAFLLNMRQIENISGNSQGYIISLFCTEEKIPVSRAKIESFDVRYTETK
nr:LytTR family DNA-binding domain-containing protein [Pedobacter panaciterrae]